MSKVANVMIKLLEEQAAMLNKHIAALKELSGDDSVAAATDSDDGKKKKKKVVDPNKPKRPLTGYQIFMAEQNPKLKQANPEDSAAVIMAKVARAWTALTAEQKATYNKKAEGPQNTFHQEMAEYKAKNKPEKAAKKPVANKEASSSSSSAAAPAASKKATPAAAPAVVAVPVPVPVPVETPKEKEKHHHHSSKKHKHADVEESHGGDETEKKHKVRRDIPIVVTIRGVAIRRARQCVQICFGVTTYLGGPIVAGWVWLLVTWLLTVYCLFSISSHRSTRRTRNKRTGSRPCVTSQLPWRS